MAVDIGRGYYGIASNNDANNSNDIGSASNNDANKANGIGIGLHLNF